MSLNWGGLCRGVAFESREGVADDVFDQRNFIIPRRLEFMLAPVLLDKEP